MTRLPHDHHHPAHLPGRTERAGRASVRAAARRTFGRFGLDRTDGPQDAAVPGADARGARLRAALTARAARSTPEGDVRVAGTSGTGSRPAPDGAAGTREAGACAVPGADDPFAGVRYGLGDRRKPGRGALRRPAPRLVVLAAGTMLAATAIIVTTSTAAAATGAGAPAPAPGGPPVPSNDPPLPMGRPAMPVFPTSGASTPPASLQAPGKDDPAAKDGAAARDEPVSQTAGIAGAGAHEAPSVLEPAAGSGKAEQPRATSEDAGPSRGDASGSGKADLPRLPKAMRLEHEFVTNVLRSRDIEWRSTGNCSDRERPTCTSFSGLRWTTLEGLLRFADESGCRIVVTGGTERGHAPGPHSHYNGYKIDIAPNRCVDGEIEGYDREGVRGDGAKLYRSPQGGLYARESDHWDITYT